MAAARLLSIAPANNIHPSGAQLTNTNTNKHNIAAAAEVRS
jgi:hypothetical protein